MLLPLLLCSISQAANIDVLVDAEHAFARAAAAKGIRSAFLEFLAPDAIVFRPKPVAARQWIQSRGETPGLLSWQPAIAEISLAGDLGYTTGPYQYREEKDKPPSGYGHYTTLWKKQPDGSWKAVLDGGSPQIQTTAVEEAPAKVATAPAGNRGRADKSELLAMDRSVTGLEPMGGDVSASGDLGYTYGVKNGSVAYLRIWKRGKTWTIIRELPPK